MQRTNCQKSFRRLGLRFILSTMLGCVGHAYSQEYATNDQYLGAHSGASYSDGSFSNQAVLDSTSPRRLHHIVGLDLGILALGRSTPADSVIAVDQFGNTLLNASQVQGDMGAGLDASLDFYNLFSNQVPVDVEMRFFQADDMGTIVNLSSQEVNGVFFNAVPADPPNSGGILTQSKVRSFESNLVARTPYRFRFLVGFRFFELDEIFDFIDNVETTTTERIGFFSRAENTMSGIQVGTEVTLLTNGASRLFGSFKYGLMNNDVVGSAEAQNPVTGGEMQSDVYDSTTSNLLDFQIGGSLCLSRTFSLYCGYQGIVLEDVILGITQSQNNSIFVESSQPFYESTQFHGFKISGMATW
jgi:hypothetical protein